MDQPIELSVIILCYRTGEQIIPLVDELKRFLPDLTDYWQLVLVGNYIPGSGDRTNEIVEDIAARDYRIKSLAEPKKGMMGWDMRKGLQTADGQCLCVIDGDGQYPLESIRVAWELIRETRADLVKSYRKKRYDGLYRTLVSKVYNFTFSLLFPGLGCRDVNSKPKIMSREAYDRMDLKSNDWFIDAEMMITLRRERMRFKEFPIVFKKLKDRPSFVQPGAIFEFMWNFVLYRIREFVRK